jgi:hypothetical protein
LLRDRPLYDNADDDDRSEIVDRRHVDEAAEDRRRQR